MHAHFLFLYETANFRVVIGCFLFFADFQPNLFSIYLFLSLESIDANFNDRVCKTI